MRYAYDLNQNDWAEWIENHQLPAWRAGQIHRWISRGIISADEMTDLPLPLRRQLADDFIFNGLVQTDKRVSALDGTVKYVFRLAAGKTGHNTGSHTIESVLMQYQYGKSVCISSQAGCLMGCTFCASTGAGFGRNLSAGEMLAQVALIARDSGSRIGHVVVMGIGEPLDNYDNLILFLRKANDPAGLNIGMRHISVSTCGLVPEMLKFTNEGMPVTLSVSLHAPNDIIRRRLMPIARRYSMDELLAACRRHTELTGRRISFEYALIDGVNDRPEHASELAVKLKGMLCHVNLIPANEFFDGRFRRSSTEAVHAFQERLIRSGINATVRRELGTDIMAACGQLRRKIEGCGNP